MDYGAALDMRFAATRRGFESLPLRHDLGSPEPGHRRVPFGGGLDHMANKRASNWMGRWLLAGIGLASAGCSSVPIPSLGPSLTPASSPWPSITSELLPPTPAGEQTYQFSGLSMHLPADWRVVEPHVWTAPVGPRLFISSAPIADPCADKFRTADCWRPLAELPENGILITFAGSAVASLPNPTPVPIEQVASGPCGLLGGERELVASFPGYSVSACLRGPADQANEAVYRAILTEIAGA